MVDITSSDMYLLFETPRTAFDERRMTNEFESYESLARQRRDKVAGTTRVGVQKSVGGRSGNGQRSKVVLKARVILERDVADMEEAEDTASCILI